jgi:hypothetical protein
MQIVYGATGHGFVSLFVVEPGGKASLIKKSEVEAGKAYLLSAATENPVGDHQLVAIYSADAGVQSPSLASIGDFATKGIHINDDGPDTSNAAVYRFYIRSK